MIPAPVDTLDRALHTWVVGHRSPVEVAAAQVVTVLGSLPGLVVLTGLLVVLVLRDRRVARRPLVALVVAGWVALAYLMSVLLKQVVGRPRPPLADMVGAPALDPSFPSGHALSTTVLLGMSLLIGSRRLAGRRGRVTAGVVLTAVWVLVGVSRVVLGYHWPSDVVGGWVVGAVLVGLGRCLVRSVGRLAHGPALADPGWLDERD